MSRNWDMDKQNVAHPSPAVVHSGKTRTAGGMGLKDLMLSERSQAEKTTSWTITFMWNVQKTAN